MPTSTEALVEAVERSLFAYPLIAGMNDDIHVVGVEGRETSVSHPIANLVGCASLAEAQADPTIATIRARFATSGKSFGWVTSVTSRPLDIARRLTAAGFVQADEMAGMVLSDPAVRIQLADVQIQPATTDEQRQAVDMSAEAYAIPADVASWFTEMQIASGSTTYHAYVADRETPVAFGNLVVVPGTSTVLLAGAGTLPEYRGRGIYTALVARRLADAWMGGAEAAIIQAARQTSAALCARLGFREVLPMELYAWVPPGVELDLHA